MAMRLKSTLEQWNVLREIDKAGSIQAAAVSLNKSHTTLIYSIKKLEVQLAIQLVEIREKRAVLTEQGRSLLRRANAMLEQAKDLEDVSRQLAAGMESEITVSIDHLCDPALLYQPMADYLRTNSATSIQVIETSLSKTTEMVTKELADIAIITLPVTNYPAEAFSMVSLVPVVSSTHALAKQTHLCMADFATYCQIVVRDLGVSHSNQQARNVGWLKANQRITVDNFDHAFRAVEQGVGFCRLPSHVIEQRNHGQLKILEVKQSNRYQVPLHISLPKGVNTGTAAYDFYALLLSNAKIKT